ncbi:MAG: hypothetical protein HN337_03705 [Deltaproteobacteria bacterium]|jgi:hypothetical protein|nr:hypothetical protein [Deltaproteobacteria bacterium]
MFIKKFITGFALAVLIVGISGELFAPNRRNVESECDNYVPPSSFSYLEIKYISGNNEESYVVCFKNIGEKEPSMYINSDLLSMTPLSGKLLEVLDGFLADDVGLDLDGGDMCYYADTGGKPGSAFDGNVTNVAMKLPGEACMIKLEFDFAKADYVFDDSQEAEETHKKLCETQPTHGDCDYDGDGVSNRLDPCIEEPEEFSSDGKTPLDGINDGCPESSGQTGGGGSQKYGSGGNPYNQNPAGTGYYPSDNFSSGEGACTLIENSRMTFASVLFVLIPIIALILGYAGVPARARRRGRNKQKSGGRRYYN